MGNPTRTIACVTLLSLLPLAGCPKKVADSSVQATRTQLVFISNQIEIFASKENRAPYPDEGLAVLFDGVQPVDAWGNQILYVTPGPSGLAFDLVSYGSDGQPGGKGSAADLYYSEIE